MASLLALHGVGKRYATGTVALQGVDLTIADHEFVSILGPSGCGKSTALRIIAGLAVATEGEVRWPGTRDPRDAIGFVFQEPTLMPWTSAFDNVWLPLRLKGVSRATARAQVNAALERVGLLDAVAAYPRELSGGMKMRVSIARALVMQPRLLLMDEPFAALDEVTRFRLNDDTLALWRSQSFTTVFVTHSVYEAVYLSSRIVVMAARPGRIVDEIAVDAPYPRSEAFRATPQYTALCVRVSQALQSAGAAHA